MVIRLAANPVAPLFRIGRRPDPLAFPPRAFAGGGRYDHPDAAFLTLYAAEQRRGAFVETLDVFRPAITDLAAAQGMPLGDPTDESPTAGVIPESYFCKLLVRLRLNPEGRWHDHRLTQAIAVWAYGLGYHGIVYRSCHDATLDCWALFDRALFSPVGSPRPVARDDSDLLAVADLFGLTVPGSGGRA